MGSSGLEVKRKLALSDGTLTLHLFMVASSLEIFANEGERAISDRIFPDPAWGLIHEENNVPYRLQWDADWREVYECLVARKCHARTEPSHSLPR